MVVTDLGTIPRAAPSSFMRIVSAERRTVSTRNLASDSPLSLICALAPCRNGSDSEASAWLDRQERCRRIGLGKGSVAGS